MIACKPFLLYAKAVAPSDGHMPGPEGNGAPEDPPVQKTILLVDDDPIAQDLGQHLFEQEGYRVIIAPDGEQALRLYMAYKERINLVLLDYGLPGMDGLETLRALMRINPRACVLMWSACLSEEEIREFLAQGARGFIPKPCDISHLLSMVRTLLGEEMV